ncbi:MAG: motility associated factor glycosyltransferase family protein [Brevinematia bacterium]
MIIVEEKARDGNVILKLIKNGKEYYLSSKYYPLEESKKIAKNLNFKNEIILIIGIGNPYLIEEIKEIHPEKKIIILEPLEEVVEKLKEINLLPKCEIKVIKEENELKEFLSSLSYFDYYIHPQYKNLIEDIKSWEDVIKSTIHTLAINKNTLIKFGRVWAKNFILSIEKSTSSKGVNLIFRKFQNSNAIVIGAGPSLDEHIKTIKELYNECVIISSDTSFPYLVRNNLIPDFVITVDPQLKNFIYLLQNKNYENTIFIADTLYIPLIYDFIPRENIFLFDSPFKVWQRIIEKTAPKGEIMVGGSVICSAIDLSNKIGASNIILAGNDLSYPKRKIYSKQNFYEINFFLDSSIFSPYDQWKILSKYPLIKKSDKESNTLLTDPRMIIFKEWIEKYIKTNNINLINLSTSGLVIEGAKSLENYIPSKLNRDEINKIKKELINLPLNKPYKLTDLKEKIISLQRNLILGKVGKTIETIEEDKMLKELLELSLQKTLLKEYTEDEFIKALEEEVKYLGKILKIGIK